MPEHQTISFLTRRFREIGLRPDARRGQNFLVDVNLQKLLVRAAGLEPEDVVLEIGTGTGALTAQVAQEVAAVVSVEIDPHLHELARELLFGLDNVTLLHQDALRNKNAFDPQVVEAVQGALAGGPGRRFKLVANLPYSVATPVISNLLAWEEPPVTMTVTIQRELADRLVAEPSTKDYGSLSVWVQSQALAQIVRIMPPSVFWPRPKVHSAIVQVILDSAARARIADLHYFHHFARALFLHRRKLLRTGMAGTLKGHLTKGGLDEILVGLGHGPQVRAEQLSVEQILALCEAVRAAAPEWKLG